MSNDLDRLRAGMSPEFRAYREAGNTGPWNHDANAPADETNTPAEQLAILDALRNQPMARRGRGR